MTTQEATHKRRFEGLHLDNSRKVLKRLTKEKYLSEYPLFDNKPYWRVGPRAIKSFHFPKGRDKQLGSQRLPYDLACLALTTLNPTRRTRLLPHELVRALPWFPDSLLQWAYLWEDERLRTIRVEPRIRPDKLVRKLREQVFQYAATSAEFSQLIDDGRFFFVIVATSEAAELAIQAEADHENLPVEIETSYYETLERFM